MSIDLTGRRILVVEDSPMIATVLDDMLRDLGCMVVGPVGNVAIAVELAGRETIDAAIIDVNIRGGKVFPAADALAARDIPFLLASGYADWSMPEYLQGRPRLAKPYTAAMVESALRNLLDKGEAKSAD